MRCVQPVRGVGGAGVIPLFEGEGEGNLAAAHVVTSSAPVLPLHGALVVVMAGP